MGIDNYITDPKTQKNVHVVTHNDKDANNALVVATHPLKQFENKPLFFSNPDFGIDMNVQAGTYGGSSILVYDENVEWTTSIIVGGGWIFNSGTVGAISPHSGSVMIDATGTAINDTMQLAKGSDFNLTNYVAITGWIALTDWSVSGTKEVNLLGWDTVGGAQVGTTVNLGNYVNTGVLNTWQKFTISLADMALVGQTINAFRITTIDLGPGGPPDYFLDEIEVQEQSTTSAISSAEFKVEPEQGTWLYVYNVKFFIADAYDSTLVNSSMPKLLYNQILGEAALTTGLLFRRYKDGEINFSGSMKQLSDLLEFPGSEIDSFGGDGTNTWISVKFTMIEPFVLKSEDRDYLSLTVSDDLSGLLRFRASIGAKEEQRQ